MKKAAAKQFEPGERVTWDAPQGSVSGKVVRVVRKPTRVKGHLAKASPEHPEVLVESERTGARAVHQPAELRRKRRKR